MTDEEIEEEAQKIVDQLIARGVWIEVETIKIKDLPKDGNLRGVKFKVPEDHPECSLKVAYWYSQWGYADGKAGIWCKENMEDTKVHPIFLDKLDEVLEFDVWQQ